MSREKDRGEILLLTTGGNGRSYSVCMEHAGINCGNVYFFQSTLKHCKFLFNGGLAGSFPSALILDDFHPCCVLEKT